MTRRILILLIGLLIFGVGYVAWTLAELPPVRFILRYGFSPGCEPTGEKMTLEGVEFVEIGPGIFRMGSDHRAEGGDWLGRICEPFGLPWGQRQKLSDEMPVHWVEFRRGFWIASTEITNAQFERFNPDHRRTTSSDEDNAPWGLHYRDDDPAVNVSWVDAKEYCAWLSRQSGRPIRPPSEAEWECACRAGSTSEFTFGDDELGLTEYAWYDVNSGPRMRGPQAHPVAKKWPNAWGLYDLHGNVQEWCEDPWHDSYIGAPTDGAAWVDEDHPERIYRGGSYTYPAHTCRSAIRHFRMDKGIRAWWIGFRPAISRSED